MKKTILNPNRQLLPLKHAALLTKWLNINRLVLLMAIVACITACKKSAVIDADSVPGLSAGSKLKPLTLTVSGQFKLMSFNVRGGSYTADSLIPHAGMIWTRKSRIRQIIVDNNPDVFGLQEFTDNNFENWFMPQMSTLGYSVYFAESAGHGSPKVIFYKSSRFTLQSSGTFDIDPLRSGTWVILTDNVNSNQYFFCNSHWSPNDADKAGNASALISAVQTHNPNNLPEVVFGDFNSEPSSSNITNVKNSLDVIDALGDADGGMTYHGWDATGDSKIDWLLCNKKLAYTSFQVITTSYSGDWPSDHWPVMATFIPAIFGSSHSDTHGLSTNANTKFFFGDINGDGKEDKVYWNNTYDSGKPQVFLSNGDGTFAATAVAHTAGASTLSTTRYYYADVDGDGKADEILWDPNLNSGKTMVYLATGGGSFSSTAINNTQGTSGGTTTVFNFADINGDGRADKIYWNGTVYTGHPRVYLATSGGFFSNTGITNDDAGASTIGGTYFYYADVNGDDMADKIMWQPTLNSGKPSVYLADGDGTFTAATSYTNSGASSASAATNFYFTDVNGDGKADKIYWNPTTYMGKLKVYLSQPGGIFDGPIYSLWGRSENSSTYFYFADINGDGKKDQVRWNYSEASGALSNYFAQ